jgi:hypothetical protein
MADKKEQIKIKFSKNLLELLKELEDEGYYLAFELLWLSEPDSKHHNGLRISYVDCGPNNKSTDFDFLVTIDGKRHKMKIGKFVRYYFPNLFSNEEVTKFVNIYNRLKNGGNISEISGEKIEVSGFKYNPKDVRSTFLSLVTKTYPHGHEEEVLQFLPKGLQKDKFGNYYKIIDGDDTTMFTSHLDTADRTQVPTNLYSRDEDGDEIIYTDGRTILGADDKSGVAVMMYMMDHNIPGIYYFFIGEERGGIGSNQVSGEWDKFEFLKNVKKCISFDRRRTTSVITHQLGRQCCSNDFGTGLCKAYNTHGLNLSLDNGGIYTDSASFMDDIPECTNVSVGYLNEHTGREEQNMTFLIQLCEASIKVDWKSLPVARKIGLNQDLIRKHKSLIDAIKGSAFGLEVKMVGLEDRIFVRIDLDDAGIGDIYNNLVDVQTLLTAHKVDTMAMFSETYIKIELK